MDTMHNMTGIPYGAKGEERKRLVKAIAEFKQTVSEYCGAPTFKYLVDDLHIDQEGTVIFTMPTDEEEIEELKAYLAGKGFYPEGMELPADEDEAVEPGQEPAKDPEITLTLSPEIEPVQEPPECSTKSGRLTLELPREGFTDIALENLQKLIDSKASLLKKSLGTEDLTVNITEDRIRFPWFSTSADEMETAAYTHLIRAIGEMARKAKRVTAVDKPVESEKYSFRVWLLRLGFVGAEYKHERAILMKNLSGHAAFKNQADADAFAEKQKAKRAAACAENTEESA